MFVCVQCTCIPVGIIGCLFGNVYVDGWYVMVMSSVYIVSFNGDCGVGVYMLNNVGNGTPATGIPVWNWRCVDVLFMNVV